MTRKLLEVSLSAFLITCTFVLALGLTNSTELFDKYKESLEAKTGAANSIKNAVENISNEYLVLLKEQSAAQKELLVNIVNTNTVLFEAGIAFGSRIMEVEGHISSTDANKIINDSIDKIYGIDERLGVLAKAFNDASRKKPNQY